MDLLIFKAISSPLLLLLASFALRYWGASMGGFLIGLPLTSGPISVFFALEYGDEFALCAASGSLAAVTGQAAFAIAYCTLIGRGWAIAMLGASTAYVLVAELLQNVGLSPTILCAVAMLALAISLRLIPVFWDQVSHPTPSWWDLPAKMALVSLLVVGETVAAGYIDAGSAGILASFPVMTAILSSFAHMVCGGKSARPLMRGLCAGLFGSTAFFYIVSMTLTIVSDAVSYGIATLGALTVQMMTLRLVPPRACASPQDHCSAEHTENKP